MLSKQGFYNSVITEISKARAESSELQRQLDQLERDINPMAGKYDRKYIDTVLRPQRDALKRQIIEKQSGANKKIRSMCDSYIEELRGQDELRPEDLTDDVRLLNAGVKLNSGDIKAMLNRNRSNRTMCQVILRYAEEHNIETDGTMYIGNSNLISNVKALPTIAETCIRWSNSDHVMNELVGENTALHQYFND